MSFNFEYDKLFLKKITILIPKYHGNLTSFLTPILGLYGVNIKEFINEFQLKTKFLNLDVVVPVRVSITKIKSFSITIDTPYVSNIISNIQISTYNDLSILSLYKIFLIKSIFANNFFRSFESNKTRYKSFRRYVSLTFVKKNSLIYIKKSKVFLNFSEIMNKSTSIKRNLLFFYNYNKLINNNRYGYLFFFSNADSSLIEYLKNFSLIYRINFFKFKPHYLVATNNLSVDFLNEGFYWGSKNFNYFVSFFEKFRLSIMPNFFPLFVRIRSNLLSYKFYRQVFIKEFYDLTNVLKIIKLLRDRLNFLPKLFITKLLLLPKLLNANVSSTNS